MMGGIMRVCRAEAIGPQLMHLVRQDTGDK